MIVPFLRTITYWRYYVPTYGIVDWQLMCALLVAHYLGTHGIDL
jgi:hypothetical protein